MSLEGLRDFCNRNAIECRQNEPLREHCTFAIGGPAALFIEPDGEFEAHLVIEAAASNGVRYMALGNGSNVLFRDEGYSGAILRLKHGFTHMRVIQADTIECGAGASLTSLTQFALQNSLAGLEFAHGIPGSVGGGCYMNAGAYGGEMKDVLLETRHITTAGETGSLSGDGMGLGYRHSAYCDNGFTIMSALFRLKPGDKSEISARMEDYMRRRREKQPLEMPSAGSAFRRPPGGYASELIERCGLKGKRIGGAMVSVKHAGFIVNAGGATSADVLALIEFIREEVKAKTGFNLESEVRVIEP